MTTHILVKCQGDQIAAVQEALNHIDCGYEVNTDPWAYHRKYHAMAQDDEFRKREQDRNNNAKKKRYRDDAAFREQTKAAARERYHRKKDLAQQQQIAQQ